MMPLTKWCGISCALHLAFASAVVLMASPEAQRPRKVIMVTLDFVAAPDFPQPEEPRDQARALVRPAPAVTPGRVAADRPSAPKAPGPADKSPEPSRSEPVTHPPQPVSPAGTAATRPGGTEQARELRDEREMVKGTPASAPSAAIQPAHPVQRAGSEKHPAPESVQQRYVKENFAYIRDVITKRLVYPPMARRMNWSGKSVVSFTIVEDGSVHTLQVIQSSGYPLLDKSALETVRQAAPFPKPPARAEIVVPISFRML